MTLTPSAQAISLCNFPCVANSFACANFVAISTLECLFLLGIAACIRPSLRCAANLLLRVRCYTTRSLPDNGNPCSNARSEEKRWSRRLRAQTRRAGGYRLRPKLLVPAPPEGYPPCLPEQRGTRDQL